MKFLGQLLFFLFISINAGSATVTWTGGTGAWHIGSNWDTGIKPTATDDVEIPSGSHVTMEAGRSASIHSLTIADIATLVIKDTGSLKIKSNITSTPLNNWGRIEVYGDFILKENYSNYNAINNQEIYIGTTGFFKAWRVDKTCLVNSQYGHFENHGEVVFLAGIYGINNEGEFFNYGEVSIADQGTCGFKNEDGALAKNYGDMELLNNLYGIINFGVWSNTLDGYLDIEDVDIYGIDNRKVGDICHFLNLGELKIRHSDTYGIFNEDGAKFTNYRNGEIDIQNCESVGIYQVESNFNNRGTINLSNSPNASYAMRNQGGTLRNFLLGEIIVSSSGEISNTGASALTDNFGMISVTDDRIYSSGPFINRFSGNIDITNGANGIYVFDSEFTNKGVIDIYNAVSYAIYLATDALLKNYDAINVFDSENATFISSSADALSNYGEIKNTGEGAFRSYGPINNESCALISTDGDFITYTPAILENQGFIELTDAAVFAGSSSGIVNNDGWINQASTGSVYVTSNNSIITSPYEDALQVGVLAYDIFDIASSAEMTVLGIFTDEALDTEAGTYDQAANTFIPDAESAGLTEFYVQVEDLSEGCQHIFQWSVESPVLPFKKNVASTRSKDLETQLAFSLMPNPSNGATNISVNLKDSETGLIEVIDLTGRLIQRYSVLAELSGHLQIDVGDPGMYLIRLMVDGNLIDQKKWSRL